MIFYFAMVNAWSLLGSIVNGTFEKDYPLMDKSKKEWSEEDEIRELDDYYDFKNVGAGNTAHENDGLDYEIDFSWNDYEYYKEGMIVFENENEYRRIFSPEQ